LKIHGRGEKDGRENDLVKIAKIVEITISSMRNFLNEEGVLHQNASLIIRKRNGFGKFPVYDPKRSSKPLRFGRP
jgi:hypothetical protein